MPSLVIAKYQDNLSFNGDSGLLAGPPPKAATEAEINAARAEYKSACAEFREVMKTAAAKRTELAASSFDEGVESVQAWREAIYATNGPRIRMELAAFKLMEIETNPDQELADLCFRALDRAFKELKMGRAHQMAKTIKAVLLRNNLMSEQFAENLRLTLGLSAAYVGDHELARGFIENYRSKINDLSENEVALLGQVTYQSEHWQIELQQLEQDLEHELPRVRLTTDIGVVEIELFSNNAPETVANFVKLVESGFYDGTVFEGVFAGRAAHGGVMNTKGEPKFTPVQFPDESKLPSARKHFYGYVTKIPAEGPRASTSRFAILMQPIAPLDGNQTVIGRVLTGMDFVEEFETTMKFDKDDKLEEILGARPTELIKAEMIPASSAASRPENQPARIDQ